MSARLSGRRSAGDRTVIHGPVTGERQASPASWTRPIEDLFRAQVALGAGRTAVVHDRERLSYGELHERAVALARGLVRSGVDRETPVGMAFDRSVEAIVAMLGIVLAGGAYVPVNPGHPAARVQRVVRSSDLRLVLTSTARRAAVADRVASAADVRTIAGISRGGGDPYGFAPPAAGPGHSPLGYVMHTSGSTGEPKGVMVEHQGIARLVKDTGYLDFSPAQRFLHGAALEFDASTLEVWGALLNGAALYIADEETMLVPQRYAAALRRHRITVAWLTAPLFRQFAGEDPAIFAPLRTLVTGGDVVSPGHVREVLARNPGLQVLNGYGPTENTTFTTVFAVKEPPAGPLPIGRPIPGTTVLIRDEQGRIVPPGTVGELWAGGLGVARGYLNQPELTRQRFTMLDGERYYRTGDRVHVDADGLVHFHGRTDDQVKVRGNLVELKEVDAALLAVPGVAEAHTLALGERGRDVRLVSYVVAPGTDDQAIKAALRRTLPPYMRPDRLLRLSRLPLDGNGKVDRKALPPPAPALVPRRTCGHSELAGLWAGVLGLPVESIALDDDFFALGGDSIKLGTLIGRIGRELGLRLPLAEALARPALAAMGAALEQAKPDGPARSAIAAGGPYDLHPSQRAMYAIWQADPASLAYNVPVRVDIRGPLDPLRLRAALAALVERHEALRMTFAVHQGRIVQTPAAPTEPEFRCLNGPSPAAVGTFVRPFPAGETPLLRGLLLRTGEDCHALYLDVHHIVFDGVSLRILLEELLDLCLGASPAAGIRYGDVAQWCHDRLAGAGEHERYWRDELGGPCPSLDLPLDRPRGPRRAVRGAVVRRVLGPEAQAALRAAARRYGTTLYVVMLAGYAAMLARVTGQRDFVVGTPVSGRDHPDLEGVVGMFVRTVCLRVRLDGNLTMAGLVERLAVRVREALRHQAYPFERLAVPCDPARNPLFDAFFALQNIDFHALSKGGLDFRAEVLNVGTTRFDLNLQAYPRPGELVLDLEYACELFEASSAEYLLAQYLEALADLETRPDAPVCPLWDDARPTPIPDFDF